MTDVSVIGLGNMGAAIAHAFLDAGHQLTVWNRSPQRCQPLVQRGARAADSAADALQASPVTVVCLTGYDSFMQVFGDPAVAPACADRTVINVTTGAPAHIIEAQALMAPTGVKYLEGHIPAYPREIGLSETMLIYAGPTAIWEEQKPLLLALGGQSLHVDDEITAAGRLNAGVSSFFHVALVAYLEAIAFTQTQGMSLDTMSTLAHYRVDRMLKGAMDASLDCVKRGNYGSEEDPTRTDQSSLSIHRFSLAALKELIDESGSRAALLDQVMDYMAQAEANGQGALDLAVLVENMKPAS